VYEQLDTVCGLLRRQHGHRDWKVVKRIERDNDDDPAADALNAFTSRMVVEVKVNIDEISERREIPPETLLLKLQEWNERGIIELRKPNVVTNFRALKPLPSAEADVKLLVPVIY